jgi:large subunit ribosomal protein L22
MSKKAHPPVLTESEAEASIRMLRVSPRKLNLVAQLIRGLDVDKALTVLTACEKRIAVDVKKVLLSAIANAENNKQLDVDALYVRAVNVGKSITLKRLQPRARGRAGRIHKPFSRMSIVVKEHGEVA